MLCQIALIAFEEIVSIQVSGQNAILSNINRKYTEFSFIESEPHAKIARKYLGLFSNKILEKI